MAFFEISISNISIDIRELQLAAYGCYRVPCSTPWIIKAPSQLLAVMGYRVIAHSSVTRPRAQVPARFQEGAKRDSRSEAPKGVEKFRSMSSGFFREMALVSRKKTAA